MRRELARTAGTQTSCPNSSSTHSALGVRSWLIAAASVCIGRCRKRSQLSRSCVRGATLLLNWSHVGEHAIKWPGNPVEIKHACEKARVLPLPAGSGSHEPVKLLAGASPLLCGLLLESPE